MDFQVSGDGRTKPNKLGWAIGEMLPTPSAADAMGGHLSRSGDRSDELLLPGLVKTFLPTPEAQQSGSTPESHLARKPGRKKVTALNIVAEYELLPTPAVNDMGEGKTLEWWDDWAPRQKAADGRPAPHGRSLAIEAQRMLPTPKATNNENRQSLDRYGMNLGMALESIGATTDPLSDAGKPSSDDPHQPQLSLDELALPA